MFLFNNLQRITSSGRFIPEIDGLRFVAIMSVVVFHLNGFILAKQTAVYSDNSQHWYIFQDLFQHGHYGVELFFVISGLILGLPFASHYINQDKLPSLKNFYIRRVTRLEPPYILSMLLLFFASVFVVGKFSLGVGLPSLLASLTYTHNIFYGRDSTPLINNVAWSLEIEIQFYLLAPFFAKIFSLEKNLRRIILLACVPFFSILQAYIQLPFVSLFEYVQFFAVGFLLADLYVSKEDKFNKNNILTILLGVLFFCVIWSYNLDKTHATALVKIIWFTIFPLAIFGFYYLVLFTKFWKGIFSHKFLTVIGGMCYTIYLLHYSIISMFGNWTIKRSFSNTFWIDWLIQSVILSSLVLIICSIYFALIERPCMQKDWHKRLFEKVKSKK
jgi:peptidoglycan/LPS O-acetylase OafA/YrhL